MTRPTSDDALTPHVIEFAEALRDAARFLWDDYHAIAAEYQALLTEFDYRFDPERERLRDAVADAALTAALPHDAWASRVWNASRALRDHIATKEIKT